MISQKTLKFYVYIDGENDIPFYGASYEDFIDKNGEVFTTADGFVFNVRQLNEQLEIGSFRYDAKRMGGAPSISCTLMYPSCLDNFWSDAVYVVFNEERFFLKQTPTSSKNNEDARYKHELELVSERMILDNTYYFDAVVGEPLENDKPVTNSTKFFFVGKIEDFVKKINASLQYTKLQKVNEDGSISGYHVVLDEGMVSEDKQVSFDNAVISQALQECYNTFGIPFYFDGKTIHVGFTNNAISDILEYGVDNQLLSITKTNSNFKVVNRASGTGSSENIPYFYPNNSPKGEIEAVSSNPALEVVIEDYEKYSNEIKIDESIRYGTKKTIENINTVGVFSETYIQETGHAFTAGVSATFISDGPTNVEAYFTPTNNCHFEVHTISGNEKRVEGVSFYDAFIENPRVRVYQDGVLLSNKLTFQPFEEVKVNFFCNKSTKIAIVITMQAYPDLAVSGRPYKNVVSGNVDWEIKGHQDGEKALWLKEDKEVSLEDIGLSYLGEPQYEDTITQCLIKRVNVSDTLQPSIYRATDAKERFYNAINYPFEYKEGYELQYGEYVLDGQVHNDVYKKDDGTYYEFVTPYVEGHPREHVFAVDDIKPTIKEMTNDHSWVEKDSEGNDITVFQRIDMFSEFAYDEGDNDETYIAENGKVHFKHPYFFAKLRKLPFNLFDHASENGAMTFSMTSGNCGSCNFEVGVSEDEPQYNTVQVYEEDTTDENGVFHPKGSLVRDEEGRVLCGLEDYQDYVPMQPRQQDTVNYEVWIALKKEESTYGIVMPKAPVYNENGTIKVAGSRPIACSSENSNDGDTFVITNITLPNEYIYKAEKKLEKAILKYILENNAEKFNFSVNFSRIFLEENPNFLAQLNENARITVRYNEQDYLLYVSSFSYQMSDGDILPSISIELDDTLTISQNALQQAIDGVKSEIGQAISTLDVASLGSRIFLRKDVDDTCEGIPYFKRGLTFGQGGDVKIYNDGSARLSIDYLEVTKKATFTSLEIQEKHHVGGQLIISPAAMTCSDIAEVRDENGTLVAWRCYMQTKSDGEEVFNTFALDDQAICQTFDGLKNTYYWRLVVGVGEDYIDLSVEDCDEGSDVPSIGDKIVQLGNRRVIPRQSAQVLSSHGDNAPSFIMYNGIDSYSLEGKNISGVVWNPNTLEPQMYSYGDFFFGDRTTDEHGTPTGQYVTYQKRLGDEEKKLHINADVTIGANSSGLENLSEWSSKQAQIDEARNGITLVQTDIQNIQDQIDGVVENHFYEGVPTTENFPANQWTTDEDKANHVGDTYTNIASYDKDPDNAGKAWRWTYTDTEHTGYHWHPIADSDAVKALLEAYKAQDTANKAQSDVSELQYLSQTFDRALDVTGVVMSQMVAVKNEDEEIEAFINGSNFAMDDSESPRGKLLIAAGIPEGDPETLEERAKEALTKVYEDGTVVSSKMVIQNGCYLGDDFVLENKEGEGRLAAYDYNDYGNLDQIGSTRIGQDGLAMNSWSKGENNVHISLSRTGPIAARIFSGETIPSSPDTQKLIGLYLETKDGYSVYCKEGQFAGLRPKFRIIEDLADDLTTLDHTISCVRTDGADVWLSLPEGNVEDGQCYEIWKWGSCALHLYGKGRNILRIGVSSSADQGVGIEWVGIIKLLFNKATNEWLMTLHKTE